MTQNIYQQLGLKQVINACGKMTILGVSSVAPQVMQATARAASAFVEIDRLVDRTGERVSRFTRAEDSYITSCASAGIAIAVAAAITRGDQARVMQMPDSAGMANEVGGALAAGERDLYQLRRPAVCEITPLRAKRDAGH